jgi:hypothetical protein
MYNVRPLGIGTMSPSYTIIHANKNGEKNMKKKVSVQHLQEVPMDPF